MRFGSEVRFGLGLECEREKVDGRRKGCSGEWAMEGWVRV